MLLAGGFWTSGTGGGTVIGPVLGGLAVLSFGGLVGRLAGRQWAPAGALVLALTLPELYTSRNAFSEPAVQVLLFGGICLVIDALTVAPTARLAAKKGGRRLVSSLRTIRWHELPSRTAAVLTPGLILAGLGGLALGLTSLLSLASLPYLVPMIAVAAVFLAARVAAGVAFAIGLVIGCGYGLAADGAAQGHRPRCWRADAADRCDRAGDARAEGAADGSQGT